MSEFTQFLADCWRMFTEIQVPILNISFAELWLGIFVVGISIMILRPLLGIGFGSVNNIFSGIAHAGKRGYDRAYKKRQAQINANQRDRDIANQIEAHSYKRPGNYHWKARG